ncbi:hypothetical protein RclHR1_00120005 [Rhizophagus clarus]|uniref:Uncharacterized protein n=1 Tax=Rhizophagus clarus TaxID=94130 RepID=A0A2Z6QL00_9GLOM|nr:hypothetical protein RclHR1_00120004 [Rhizophagus clarus]GBB85451.1 hypothetical protein RclHR1_00120005 [Rhizophagus clarus]GES93534.1 hypothetical protein GLOIN_2v1595986 [Rhizophagus clarus]
MFVYKPHNVTENALEKIDDSSSDPNNLERGEGDVSNSEATIIDRQDGGVTELENIGESSGTYIDDSDNKIAATKEITEGELLSSNISGNISGNKSQTNKRTTKEQITEETIKEREEIIATTTTNYKKRRKREY